jgi:acetoin utilization protein AcuB
MIAEQLIATSIIPLKSSDTGETAVEMMSEFGVRHLPIVDNQELIGVLSEEAALNLDAAPIGHSHGSTPWPRPHVRWRDHIIEAIHLTSEFELTVLPVLDEEGQYLGCITLEHLFFQFTKTASFTEPGSILVLWVNKSDYSLTEIARIVESEQMTVLSSFVSSVPDSSRIEVTLKLNGHYVQQLVATLERFRYEVKAVYHENELLDDLRERYESLISYLNV